MAARKQNPPGQVTPTTLPPVDPNAYIQNNPFPGGGTTSYGTDGSTGMSAPGGDIQANNSGIVDETGKQLPFYNLNTGPRQLLANMQDEVKRNTFLKNLYDRGWYGKGRPGGGLSDDDEQAVYRLLYSANLTGVSYNQILSLGKRSPFANAPDGGGRARVAATEDLVEIANRSALSTIGRKLSTEESSKFARAYQASQQAEASGGMTSPSTDVFFKNRIEQQYGAESDGYKYLSAISNVARLMENM